MLNSEDLECVKKGRRTRKVLKRSGRGTPDWQTNHSTKKICKKQTNHFYMHRMSMLSFLFVDRPDGMQNRFSISMNIEIEPSVSDANFCFVGLNFEIQKTMLMLMLMLMCSAISLIDVLSR